jgi:hypothetical protein
MDLLKKVSANPFFQPPSVGARSAGVKAPQAAETATAATRFSAASNPLFTSNGLIPNYGDSLIHTNGPGGSGRTLAIG